MVWICLLIALWATFSFFKDCSRMINNTCEYLPETRTIYQDEVYTKKQNAISLEITLDMAVAVFFWLIFICLWN